MLMASTILNAKFTLKVITSTSVKILFFIIRHTLDHMFTQNHICYDVQMYCLSYEGLNFPFIN